MYCQLAIKLFDHINKISIQNSHDLKMELILRLITLAAITSYCSISALKCYKCTDDENDSGFRSPSKANFRVEATFYILCHRFSYKGELCRATFEYLSTVTSTVF